MTSLPVNPVAPYTMMSNSAIFFPSAVGFVFDAVGGKLPQLGIILLSRNAASGPNRRV